MHAKVVTFQIKPGMQEEVDRLFREVIVPSARKQKGFRGGMLLTDPDTGKGKSVALWETEEDIRESERSGFYQAWVVKLGDALSMPPVREIYKVSNLVGLSVE
jgi:heme-degrading monooxygenase HmoA